MAIITQKPISFDTMWLYIGQKLILSTIHPTLWAKNFNFWPKIFFLRNYFFRYFWLSFDRFLNFLAHSGGWIVLKINFWPIYSHIISRVIKNTTMGRFLKKHSGFFSKNHTCILNLGGVPNPSQQKVEMLSFMSNFRHKKHRARFVHSSLAKSVSVIINFINFVTIYYTKNNILYFLPIDSSPLFLF